jgi:hypothetical protein
VKTIIGGSHHILDYQITLRAIQESGWADVITEVISGGATGPDAHAVAWARLHHIPVRMFFSEWDKYGLSAPQVRIEQMARCAEALILIWDGQSPGATQMLDCARLYSLRIHEHRVPRATPS